MAHRQLPRNIDLEFDAFGDNRWAGVRVGVIWSRPLAHVVGMVDW
jgi:hypothetical protein